MYNNKYNNTTNRESGALAFLKANYPMRFEVFMMQMGAQIKDFADFEASFNDTAEHEKLNFEEPLFGRLNKYARNWLRNQSKEKGRPTEEVRRPMQRLN